jgi:glycerol kinase
MVASAPEMSDLAASVDSTDGLYFVSAFSGLLAPVWRDDARAVLVGMTLAHDRRHVARAVLEGVACQATAVVGAMVADAGVPLPRLRVDGGVAKSSPLLQMQADLAGVNVERPADVETTALGAAVAAGIGAGAFDGPESLAAPAARDDVFEPSLSADARAAKWASWEAAVECTLGWADRA